MNTRIWIAGLKWQNKPTNKLIFLGTAFFHDPTLINSQYQVAVAARDVA